MVFAFAPSIVGYERVMERRFADAPTASQRPVLTHSEQALMLAVANSAEFASLPPSQLLPALAERGVYVASELSFYRQGNGPA
jgi:hypothetical protein